MEYLEVLKQKLENRANIVLNSREENFYGAVKIFYDFIHSNNVLKNIIEELESQDIDLGDWEQKSESGQLGHTPLPGDYTKRIFLCNEVMKKFANKELNCLYFSGIVSSSNIHDTCRGVAETYLNPLYEYIIEKIESVDYFLYLLLRYKNKIEWFKREGLISLYEHEKAKGEENLTKNLREYLHNQGIDYPFSTPKSPRGRADLVSFVDSLEPVPLEVKLFSKKRGVEYVKKGIRQAYRYATDYCKSIGYLLIFNLDNIELILENVDSEDNFFKVEIGNVSIFIVIVNISEIYETASQETEIEQYTIDIGELKDFNDT